MREMTDAVHEERTPCTAGVPPRIEHEVIQDELPTTLEQIRQGGVSVGPIKYVLFVDLNHRQATPLCGKCITGAHVRPFFDHELVAHRLPFGRRYDLRKTLVIALHYGFSFCLLALRVEIAFNSFRHVRLNRRTRRKPVPAVLSTSLET